LRITIGPENKKLAITYFAKFGTWPETLTLMLRGAPVPEEIRLEAEKARREYKWSDYYEDV
jgi:hypothetical protein